MAPCFYLPTPHSLPFVNIPLDLCQVIEGGDKDLEAVLFFENASEARWMLPGGSPTPSPIYTSHHSRSFSQSQTSRLLLGSQGCDTLAQHLSIIQITRDTFVVLPAQGGAQPVWWTWPPAECGSLSPAPNRPEPGPSLQHIITLNNLL